MLMQREKGKRFERDIADRIRRRWPKVIVRRSSQAERADNPDVFAEGDPVLERLWLELQDAKAPTPQAKLAQAERDAAAWCATRGRGVRWPVVVWHRLGERTTWVTLRLAVLLDLVAPLPDVQDERQHAVTVTLEAFFDMLEDAPRPRPMPSVDPDQLPLPGVVA